MWVHSRLRAGVAVVVVDRVTQTLRKGPVASRLEHEDRAVEACDVGAPAAIAEH